MTPGFALLGAALPDGAPVPEAATVTTESRDEPTIVGLGGVIYATGAAGLNGVAVRWPQSGCEFEIELPPAGDALQDLGTVLCEPKPAP